MAASRKSTLPDFKAIMERGYEERHAADASEWHDEPSTDEYHGEDKVWHWHASAIGGCTRAQILKRAGLAPDPLTVDSEMTFAFGHSVHSSMEASLKSESGLLSVVTGGEWQVVSVEKGGAHPTLPLKAKPDAVISRRGKLAVCDWKTEAGSSKTRRDKAAKTNKSNVESVSEDHKIQVTCGAMCAEARDNLKPIKLGIVCYVSKQGDRNKWDFDVQEFEITDALREDVLTRLMDLDSAWAEYERSGTLPDRLPAQPQFYGGIGPHWRCRARDAGDQRGLFCASRSVCMNLTPLPEPTQLKTIK